MLGQTWSRLGTELLWRTKVLVAQDWALPWAIWAEDKARARRAGPKTRQGHGVLVELLIQSRTRVTRSGKALTKLRTRRPEACESSKVVV
jgi:hypothetical protein